MQYASTIDISNTRLVSKLYLKYKTGQQYIFQIQDRSAIYISNTRPVSNLYFVTVFLIKVKEKTFQVTSIYKVVCPIQDRTLSTFFIRRMNEISSFFVRKIELLSIVLCRHTSDRSTFRIFDADTQSDVKWNYYVYR